MSKSVTIAGIRMEEALQHHEVPDIFNSDQGAQFTSDAFTDILKTHGIRISMDGKGAITTTSSWNGSGGVSSMSASTSRRSRMGATCGKRSPGTSGTTTRLDIIRTLITKRRMQCTINNPLSWQLKPGTQSDQSLSAPSSCPANRGHLKAHRQFIQAIKPLAFSYGRGS
ncbi:hypothetical protein [Chromohalobacter israelensis]|uniref:hypothetical protein n=1 Tax=Chromohalobacter israelensis TaxID=141390 RepID=UPI003F8B5DB4